ncbi:acyltransferase family protein [Brucella anthropi]
MLRQDDSNNFTIIRLILAYAVIVSHSFGLLGLTEPILLGRSLGNLAVHGFFAISGYLITASFLSTTPDLFVWRRIIRVAPGYLLGYIFAAYAAWIFSGYISNPVPYISNGSLWTISWEVLLYCVVLLFGLFGLLNSQVVGSFFAVSLLLIFIHMKDGGTGSDVIAPLGFMFLAGSYYRLQNSIDLKVLGYISIVLLTVAFAPVTSESMFKFFGMMNFPFGPDTNGHEVRYLFYLVSFPLSILTLCKYMPVEVKLRNDYSYGVYIFAWPVQQIIISVSISHGYKLSPFVLLILTTIFVFPLAAISWHFVERPFEKLKRLKPWNVYRKELSVGTNVNTPAE